MAFSNASILYNYILLSPTDHMIFQRAIAILNTLRMKHIRMGAYGLDA